ncbi:peptidylprolyl isomerase [Limnohabitans sp.]|uniref:peptidylprolyl isomerase n=1 Tax=Limnohabitans sp. TaxID=1907725 RepID=UPI00286F3F1E|nr:peptidylprolyl isomerase [Limnohabitans sp.]
MCGSGCGGGSGASTAGSSAPAVSSVSLNAAEANGSTYVAMTAASSNDKTVVAYCFQTSSEAPSATDACFKPTKVQYIQPPTASVVYYVWAKDSSGRLSSAVSRTVAPFAIGAADVTRISAAQYRMAVSAPNTTITSYCVTKETAVPRADDLCFKQDSSFGAPVPDSPTTYYVYGQDNLENISPQFTRVLGPCSDEGFAKSYASTLPTVCVSTSLGEFVLELEKDKAPTTVTNFLKYVNDGFYSNTVFHRIMSNFMVQGGGFNTDGSQKVSTYSAITLESPTTTGLSNLTGTISMARTTEANSATSQFFINVVDNFALNGASSTDGYAVFGRVISGMEATVQTLREVSVHKASGATEKSTPDSPPIIYWAYQLK